MNEDEWQPGDPEWKDIPWYGKAIAYAMALCAAYAFIRSLLAVFFGCD